MAKPPFMVSRKKRLEIQKENEKAQKLLKKQRQELHKPLLGLTASRGFVKPKEIESAKFLVRNNFSTPAVVGSFTGKPHTKVYTGSSMLGVATMHKSNSIPVFSVEEAISISKMRR